MDGSQEILQADNFMRTLIVRCSLSIEYEDLLWEAELTLATLKQ